MRPRRLPLNRLAGHELWHQSDGAGGESAGFRQLPRRQRDAAREGRAVVIEPGNPAHRDTDPNGWAEYRRYLASVPGPTVVVVQDPGESQDLSAQKPDILAQVKGRWENWRREMDAAEPRGPFRDY